MDVIEELSINLELFNIITLQGDPQWYIDESIIDVVFDAEGYPTYFGKRWNKTGEACVTTEGGTLTYKCGVLTSTRYWFIRDGFTYARSIMYNDTRVLLIVTGLDYVVHYNVLNPDKKSPDPDYDFSGVKHYTVHRNGEVYIHGLVKYKGVLFYVKYDEEFIWEKSIPMIGFYDDERFTSIVKELERNVENYTLFTGKIPEPVSLYDLIVNKKINKIE